MIDRKTFDCLVIGGGPAGCTAAAILAEKGRRVLVLEREKFPRYIIGESLIPYCYFPLERLGLIEKLNASAFTKKYSVQFVNRDGRVSQPFYFFQHFDHAASQSWQVTRADFDLMLMDNAKEKGAEVWEETKVTGLIKEGESVVGVKAQDKDGNALELFAPLTIDASGRSGLAMNKHGWRVRDPELNKIAIWTYFKGAKRDPGKDEGATTVAYVDEKNWFWYIPLKDDMVSVGVVGEKDYLYSESRDPATIFQRETEKNLWIKDHLASGTRTDEFRATGEFSYRSEYCAIDGLVLAGDAFAFLDPVFSSGVMLALKSGELVAEAVDKALAENNFKADRFSDYGAAMCRGMEAMRRLVYTFYDDQFSFKSVLMKYPDLKSDITDCLIGHVDRDYEDMFAAVSEFARLPEPLRHGKPRESVFEHSSDHPGNG